MTPGDPRRKPRWPGVLSGLAMWGLAALLIHSIWRGAPSDWVVHLGKPKIVVLLAAGCALFSAFYAAWRRAAVRPLLPRLALLGFSLGLSLVAAEFVTRMYLHQYSKGTGVFGLLRQWSAGGELRAQSFTPLLAICQLSANKRLVYELRPEINMEFGHRSLRTNAHGMRASQDYDPDATGAVRIVGIGDSGMFGWGVNQNQDYLSVLEKRLQAATNRSSRYEVMNLAVPGYNSGQEVERLRSGGLRFHPRIVIVGWCDNDFGAPFLVEKKKDFSSRKKLYLYSLLFYRKELLAPEVYKANEVDRSLIDPALLAYTGVDGVRKAFGELKELARMNSFHVLVFGPMRREAVEICRELGIDYFNTKEKIDKRKYPSNYAVHFMHPGPGGHGVLAENLQAELVRLGWMD